MKEDDCAHCNLDRVQWSQVVDCAVRSLKGIYDDLCVQKKDWRETLEKNDRILYILGILLLCVALQMILDKS